MISICLPTLNARSFLAERIDSIFTQTHQDWELIVCDSYSDDGTWEFLQSFAGDTRVRLFQVPKEGLYAGWNECLRRVRGDYIHIATADDTCSPDFLETVMGLLSKRPDTILGFCDYLHINEFGHELEIPMPAGRRFFSKWAGLNVYLPSPYAFTACSHINPLWNTMSAVVFHKSVLTRNGFFPVDFGTCGDVFWGARAALGGGFVYTGRQLATWRRHSAQATFNQDKHLFYFNTCEALAAARSSTRHFLSHFNIQATLPEKILYAYQDVRIRELLQLDRVLLRQKPFVFLKRFFFSLVHFPRHTLSQLIRFLPEVDAPPADQALTECLNKFTLGESVVIVD
jgi:glycosyltransferase involved in cell wall biosynthesis